MLVICFRELSGSTTMEDESSLFLQDVDTGWLTLCPVLKRKVERWNDAKEYFWITSQRRRITKNWQKLWLPTNCQSWLVLHHSSAWPDFLVGGTFCALLTWGNDYASIAISRAIHQRRGDKWIQNKQRPVNFKCPRCRCADEISKHWLWNQNKVTTKWKEERNRNIIRGLLYKYGSRSTEICSFRCFPLDVPEISGSSKSQKSNISSQDWQISTIVISSHYWTRRYISTRLIQAAASWASPR